MLLLIFIFDAVAAALVVTDPGQATALQVAVLDCITTRLVVLDRRQTIVLDVNIPDRVAATGVGLGNPRKKRSCESQHT